MRPQSAASLCKGGTPLACRKNPSETTKVKQTITKRAMKGVWFMLPAAWWGHRFLTSPGPLVCALLCKALLQAPPRLCHTQPVDTLDSRQKPAAFSVLRLLSVFGLSLCSWHLDFSLVWSQGCGLSYKWLGVYIKCSVNDTPLKAQSSFVVSDNQWHRASRPVQLWIMSIPERHIAPLSTFPSVAMVRPIALVQCGSLRRKLQASHHLA